MPETDRGSGVLTDKLRRRLVRGGMFDEEMSGANRSAIRDRIKNAILDMAILNTIQQEQISLAVEADSDLTPTARRKKVDVHERYEELFGEQYFRKVDPDVWDAYPEVVVFLFLISGQSMARLQGIVERGVEEIYSRHRDDELLQDVELTFDAQIESRLVENAELRMEHDDPLTQPQIEALLKSDEHADEEVGAYVRTHTSSDYE